MIITKLQGGHSNQLFQYATAKSLAKKLNTGLVLDLTWFDDFADVDTPRFYEIGCYNLDAKTTKNLDKFHLVDPRQPVGKLTALKRKLHLGNDIWFYYEPHQGYHPEVMNLPDNTMLIGFWQCGKYFDHLRDELIKELEPRTPLSKKNKEILNKINETESISIHVRRGDYATSKHTKEFHGLLPMSYYERAVKHIRKNTDSKDLHGFVFSNDIEWCKKNMKLDIPLTFVENEVGSDDMRLMKNCNHFIMANSTFSWWGSWLGQNPEKIVVAPKVWFKNEDVNSKIEIALDSWIRL